MESPSLKVYQGIDLIGGSKLRSGFVQSGLNKDKGAYFVRFTAGVDNLGNKYVLDILRARGITFNDQLQYIVQGNKKFSPELIVVEDNAAQKWIVQELRRTTDLPLHSFTTTANKRDLETGVPSLAVEFENGKWNMPYADDRSKKIIDIFIEELESYPFGTTSDIVMACWLCLQGIRKRNQTHHIVKDIAKAMSSTQVSQSNIYDKIKNGLLV